MRADRLALALVVALLLAPLLVVDVPPLLDYPNHLARIYLLANGAGDPVLAPMFTTHWGIIPNLAVDIVLPPLARVLPIHVAGRLALAGLLLLNLGGVLAYHRAVFAGRSLWPLAGSLVATGGAFMLGFLNFVAGVGAALLLAAGWIRWRDRHPRATIAGAVLGMVGLFFCHLMGLLFGLVLIGAYELDRAWTQRSWRRVALAMLLLPAPALFYALSPLGHAAGAGVWLGLADKLRQLLFPFINYSLTLDTCTALAVAGFLLACAATGRLRAPRHVVLALAGLAALYAVSPYAFKDTQSLDTRFTVMIALLLFAGLCPVRVPRRVIAGFLLLFALRSAVLAAAWHGHAADLAQLRAVIGGIAPGTRVTVAWVSMAEAPDYWSRAPAARRLSNGIPTDTHLPALLMIEQHAFWPLLFDESTQQPVLLRPDYQRLADQAGGQTDHRALAARPPAQSGLCGYDALLLLDAGGEADLHGFAADRLELLAATDMAALFRVRTGQVCPAGG